MLRPRGEPTTWEVGNVKVPTTAALMAGAFFVSGVASAFAGSTFTIGKGLSVGPLSISNPPYSKVVNNGTITNGGASGVPALKTTGSVSIVNDGKITAKVTSTSKATAVGISQKK